MSKSKSPSQAARDNRANQRNPTHPAYHSSRGAPPSQAQDRASHAKPAVDNRAVQLNPNSDAYAKSRGESGRSGSDKASSK